MKISIIISYYNRPSYLSDTLWSIVHTSTGSHKQHDVEVVIVDDTSVPEMQAAPIAETFKDMLDIKVLYRPEKKGRNRGVPVNIGVKHSECDLILVQDTDHMHITPLVNQFAVVVDAAPDTVVFASTYNVTREDQTFIESFDISEPQSLDKIRSGIVLMDKESENEGAGGWYCQSRYRPLGSGAPFCMKRARFIEMGGFDEDFYEYWGFEDTDFMNRLKLRGMAWTINDDLLSFHQHHYDIYNKEDMINRINGWDFNKVIWDRDKSQRTDWVANRGHDWGVL